MTQKFAALILAGGQSSRMNYQDKGLLSFKNKLLIKHVIENLETQVDDIFISCNHNKEAYQPFGYPLIDDTPFPSEGPLCAIAAGLTKIDCDFLAVAPCDTPLLPNDYVQLLFTALNAGNHSIACISTENKTQPLCALLRKSSLASLQHFLDSGQRKTMDWMFSENLIVVDDPRSACYSNVNTSRDLILLEKNYRGR